eukprot:SAG11_NODE_160_length_14023_cov_23.003017_11_plen_732_part_00
MAALRVGSLVWVEQKGFPIWPSMITYDPVGDGSYCNPPPPEAAKKYHVQFFGEEPMRAWIGKSRIQHFGGCADDAKIRTGVQGGKKIKSKKWAAAFPVALSQADSAVPLTFMQRLGAFGCSFQRVDSTEDSDDEDDGGDYARGDGGDATLEQSDDELPEQIWMQPDDPNKPKRSQSAYMFFNMHMREALMAKEPELGKNICEMSKRISALWTETNEKQKAKFVAKAAIDKARYALEMESYVPLPKVLVVNPSARDKKKAAKQNKGKKKKFKDPNAPKRAQSGYMIFNVKMRAQLAAKEPALAKDVCEMSKRISALWAQLDDAARAPYMKAAEKDKERYAVEMEGYTPCAEKVEEEKREREQREAEKEAKKLCVSTTHTVARVSSGTQRPWKRATYDWHLCVPRQEAPQAVQGVQEAGEARCKQGGVCAISRSLFLSRTVCHGAQMRLTPKRAAQALKTQLLQIWEETATLADKLLEEASQSAASALVAEAQMAMMAIASSGTSTSDVPAAKLVLAEQAPVSAMVEQLIEPAAAVQTGRPKRILRAAAAAPASMVKGEDAAAAAAAAGAVGGGDTEMEVEIEEPKPQCFKDLKPKLETAGYSVAAFKSDMASIIKHIAAERPEVVAQLSEALQAKLIGFDLVRVKKAKEVKGTKYLNELWCSICEGGGALMGCEGGCFRSFHPRCLGMGCAPAGKFECEHCVSGQDECFLCHNVAESASMLKCEHPVCAPQP